MNKRLFLVLILVSASMSFARTVSRYVYKKAGEGAPISSDNFLMSRTGPYYEVLDEDVIAQEQFTRAKMHELEGVEPYNETRKTSITRTIYD